VLKESEPMKANAIVNWQIKEQMRDFFVHTIKELQASDSIP